MPKWGWTLTANVISFKVEFIQALYSRFLQYRDSSKISPGLLFGNWGLLKDNLWSCRTRLFILYKGNLQNMTDLGWYFQGLLQRLILILLSFIGFMLIYFTLMPDNTSRCRCRTLCAKLMPPYGSTCNCKSRTGKDVCYL